MAINKVDLANIVIKKAFREHEPSKCAVACSFGKDSMAVLHLVRQFYSDVPVVFCNTGVEYPQTISFRDKIISDWNPNYHEARPEGHTFWSLADEYGLPGVRLDGKERVPKCCIHLKDKPGLRMYDKLGTELVFTGITAAESRNRWMLQRRCGEYYFAKTDGIWKCHPIMSWTEEDVLKYHEDNGIPLNPLYTEFPGVRVGCMPCTSYISWPEVMAKTAPGMYRKIQKMRGQKLIDGGST